MLIKRNRVGILELSSGWVKFLDCPIRPPRPFNAWDFRFYKTKTNTKKGLVGGMMNVEWFKENVLPPIDMYLRNFSGPIIAVATAWARECKNLEEILSLLPIQVKVLSGKEEARMALLGYINSTTRNLGDYKKVISIDRGNLSTEISILGGESVSVPKNNERSLLPLITEGSLVAVSISLFNMFTGKPDKFSLHDEEYPVKDDDWFLKEVIRRGGELVCNGTNLAFGVYYDSKKKDIF